MSSTLIRRRDFLFSSAGTAALLAGGHVGWGADAADSAAKWPDNPFLKGPFAPVLEEVTADDLPVVGSLPKELDGMLVRNGPNPQFPPKDKYHLFDGDGMLHGVRLREGRASYRNRWVRTQAWRAEHEAGAAIYPSFLDPIDVKLMAKQILAGKLPVPNRANTALVWHHGKLLALWEGGAPHEIVAPGLETVGRYNFGGQLKHACTAHPKVDATTGEMMFHAYSPYPPFLQYSIADRTGQIVHTTPIELPQPVMMHDLAITQNYTLFLDTPGVLNVRGAILGEPLFKWAPELGARIGVLPRHATGDKIRWFEIDPCFVFHIFNAFEDGDEINLLGCRFPEYPKFVDLNAPLMQEDFDKAANSMKPLAYRWRMNLKTGETTEMSLEDVDCEFPRVDDQLAGAKTQYGYAVSGSSRETGTVKFDFNTGTHTRHEFGKGRLTGEGVFVRKHDAKREDDGYLVGLLYDAVEKRSELYVLDCREFEQPAIARVLLPQRVPFGFHGIWLDGTVL